MATIKMRQKLAPYQIKWIAAEMSLQSLKDIALKFMDISEKEMNAVFDSCALHDEETLNSQLLLSWARRTIHESNQVKVSKYLGFFI